jgi:phosphatidylethanolamine/phosphatidyl-N-methylethanolamine N-methyltransferase
MSFEERSPWVDLRPHAGRPLRGNRSGITAGEVGLFLTEALRSFPETASVFPSSRHLASALLRHVDFEKASVFVELGIGTGAVTSQIVRRMKPGATLYALDINPRFVSCVQEKISDPRMIPIVGCAEDLGQILGDLGVSKVDAIISCLGLTNMRETQRHAIIDQALRMLGPSGIMSQFQYLHATGWSYCLGKFGFDSFFAGEYFEKRFKHVVTERVLRNLPPAAVFSCWAQ